MKKVLSLLFTLALALVLLPFAVNAETVASGAVEINETTFPDEKFRSFLTSQDYGEDGLLTTEELSSITYLDVSEKNIADLTGIEHFTSLPWLDCRDNQLTSLDVSKNTALEFLWCSNNQLTSLDVTKNTALTFLNCVNNQLTSLDVSKNTVLEDLCCYNNQLTNLDVSKNTALTDLNCDENQLTNLDVSKNTALLHLMCSYNQLTSLDVSENAALTYLDCHDNQLTSLDVSKNTALDDLYCYENQLASLDVSGCTALTDLGCYDNQLTSLDLSKNTALTALDCGYNRLTCLDLSKNTSLGSVCHDGNSRKVTATQNKVDLSFLAADGFDISKASNWKGGKVSGNILTATSDKVTYSYDLGNGETGSFTLAVDGLIVDRTNVPVVKTSNDAATGKVKLAWGAVDGATEYEISRATSKSGTYTELAVTGETSFIDTSAKAGTLYYYKVKAINSESGIVSAYSAIVSRTCDLAQPVATASNVASSGKVKLTWEKVEGVTEYKVYRATSKSGEYKLMKTTTGTSYTNTSAKTGSTYYYKVRAIHSNSSANSVYSEIISRACDLPQPTVKATNVASSGKVKLTWEKLDGAKEYKVYRATTKDGEYKLMKTTTGTSYTNTSADAGNTYYYKVKAIHSKSSANSAYSEVVTRTCDLARPVVTIKLKNGDPRLTWEKVDGAKEYQVYRATSKDGTYKLMKTTTGTSYTNTSAKSGKTYYYKVKAIHSKSAANSAYSSVDSIKAK